MLYHILFKMADGSTQTGSLNVGDVNSLKAVALKAMPSSALSYEIYSFGNLPSAVAHMFESKTSPNEALLKELELIDGKKIRAMTDAILTGDNSRLHNLENHAALLRLHLK
jgi:hypothetical protein